MTPAELQTTRPRQVLLLLGCTTLIAVVVNLGRVLPVGSAADRSEGAAAATVLFVTALSCFGFGVVAGLLTRRMAPMLLGYLPGLSGVLLTGLQVAEMPGHGQVALPAVAEGSWVLLNPLLWLPFVSLAIAWRSWSSSLPAPSSAPTSGTIPRSTRSRTTR